MAEPQQSPTKPSTPEFLLDDNDLLTPEDQAALDAEQTEPEPEGLPAKLPPKAPEQPQADATPEPARKEPPKNIPYNRFKEVNDKAKALEAELTQERERRARLDERVQMAREAEERARQQPQTPIEVPTKLGARPDPAIDPIGADIWDVRRENEQLSFRLEQQQRDGGETRQQIEQTRQQQEFATWVNNDAAQYRTQHPDYDAATAHAYKFRVEYWKGLGLEEARAKQIVDQEAVATAMLARQNGKSASATFYDLAQKVGFQGGSAPAALNPEVQPSPTQNARDRLNQVRNGQKFQGLSRVPAERAENVDWSNMDAQALADMPEEEFVETINDPVRGPQLRKALQRLEMGT